MIFAAHDIVALPEQMIALLYNIHASRHITNASLKH